jgi:16S rRNA (guanine(966)-N(2))-methyltransferase RsmD
MRVIAGRFRGRAVRSAPGSGTRPTTGRARAALFDWIGTEVQGAQVLDLFAGTGAVGIEALSRGAVHATFVERDRRVLAVLRQNLDGFELAPVTRLLGGGVEGALRRLAREARRFELVFADPPYGEQWTERLLGPSAVPSVLARGGALFVERDHHIRGQAPPESVVLREFREYGSTRFERYEVIGGMDE